MARLQWHFYEYYSVWSKNFLSDFWHSGIHCNLAFTVGIILIFCREDRIRFDGVFFACHFSLRGWRGLWEGRGSWCGAAESQSPEWFLTHGGKVSSLRRSDAGHLIKLHVCPPWDLSGILWCLIYLLVGERCGSMDSRT